MSDASSVSKLTEEIDHLEFELSNKIFRINNSLWPLVTGGIVGSIGGGTAGIVGAAGDNSDIILLYFGAGILGGWTLGGIAGNYGIKKLRYSLNSKRFQEIEYKIKQNENELNNMGYTYKQKVEYEHGFWSRKVKISRELIKV